MNERIEAFSGRCKKLPARLREYNAYRTLKGQIENRVGSLAGTGSTSGLFLRFTSPFRR